MRQVFLTCLSVSSLFCAAQKATLPQSPFDFQPDLQQSKFITFTADSIDLYFKDRYDKVLDSQFQWKYEYQFEFRLWNRHLEQNFDNVFILTLRDSKWIIRHFNRSNFTKPAILFTETKVSQLGVDQLWTLLVQNNVLTLPNQGLLRDRLLTYVIDTTNLGNGNTSRLETVDGVAYEFELLTPSATRRYNYFNPNAFLKHYGNVQELYNAVSIIMLIQKFLGQPISVS